MIEFKRKTIIVGHYGSGKTEFSVNHAIHLKQLFDKVALVDLDIANPYFRSRERQNALENKGIEVHHNAFGFDITEDLPAISAKIRKPLENTQFKVVIDAGGNDSGARILKQFKKYFLDNETEILFVVNANRPETKDVEGAINHINRIQDEIGMKVNGLINNTHLLKETTIKDILLGNNLCSKLTDRLGIPTFFSVCNEIYLKELKDFMKSNNLDFEIYPIKLYMRPTWLDVQF